ncbi:hypothetical protein [Cellulomonas sp. Leaf395]|uniref:hypothetical protein n=1 Tax=Cellulomonas sp. Leaf395 TaxID=1736362 RepID=UPI0006F754DC|nr:hypothetical protein [Cellulomonas sp. Leaf395]KQS97527.1 hypothetical protein ASG23_18590 [Cellulomonas sp. Leaf395]
MSIPTPDPDGPGFTDLPGEDARPIDDQTPPDVPENPDIQAPRDTPDSIAAGDEGSIEPPD